MRIGITGASSTIMKSYAKEYCLGKLVVARRKILDLPTNCDEYVIGHGVLVGETAGDILLSDAHDTLFVNFTSIVRFCDQLFSKNEKAKVCIVGSMSGEQGSYDMVYAGSKSALHTYVRHKKLDHPEQHLVCVAPWIIGDARMTTKREDYPQVCERGMQRRLGRWALSSEVARIMNFAINEPLLCNTVIEAKGGNC
jgi:NAD(P)-dependent dehydrogenase (short-subunit alcohol dehydrogenase family)